MMSLLSYIDHANTYFSKFIQAEEIKPKRIADGWSAKVGSTTYHSKLNVTSEQFKTILRVRVFGHENQFLIQHLRCILMPGDSVMEVGAYEGLYTLKLAEIVQPTGMVYGCELMPAHAEVLAYNFEQNKVNGKIFACGVSPDGGEVEVFSGTGQINGLRQDVIGRYVNEKDMLKLKLPTRTLDDLFEEIDLTKPMKLLIVMINGIEEQVLRQFSYFNKVDNLYFPVKYVKLEKVYELTLFLSSKGFKSEVHQSFIYSKRSLSREILLTHKLLLVNHQDLVPDHYKVINANLIEAIFNCINLLNNLGSTFDKVNLEIIVDLVRLGQSIYGDQFPNLDEIDQVTYPFELFALIINSLSNDDDHVIIFDEKWINLISYLIININRKTPAITFKCSKKIAINDHNSIMLFRPDMPR